MNFFELLCTLVDLDTQNWPGNEVQGWKMRKVNFCAIWGEFGKSETILKEEIKLLVAGIYCDVKYLVKTLKRN